MANCIIAFPNYVDASYYSVNFSGGNWSPSLPLTNLRNERLVKVARSLDATLASTQFVIDLGTPRDVKVIAIPGSTGRVKGNNVSRNGRVRVTASNDAGFGTIELDTGFVDWWREIYPIDSIPFEHPSFWDGKETEENAEGYAMPFVHIPADVVTARYWKIEIDDTDNPEGYVQIARLFLAAGWQPSRNYTYGATIGWEDESEVQKSLGGARFYEVRGKRRVAQIVINYIPRDEGMVLPFEMDRRLGVTKQIFLILDPDDETHLHRIAFLATMRELSPLEFPAFNLTGKPYAFEEVIA